MKDFKYEKGLSLKAFKILELAEEYFKHKDNEVLAYALLNALKPYRDTELVELFQDESSNKDTIELYLSGKRKYSQSNEEILKEAQDYVNEFLPEGISFSERKKTGYIILRKYVGMKLDAFANTFLITEEQAKTLERRSFITTFVDTYIKNHVQNWVYDYMSVDDWSWVKLLYSSTEKVNNWFSFDIEFEIPYEELTEQHMNIIQTLITNIEIYVKGLL